MSIVCGANDRLLYTEINLKMLEMSIKLNVVFDKKKTQ